MATAVPQYFAIALHPTLLQVTCRWGDTALPVPVGRIELRRHPTEDSLQVGLYDTSNHYLMWDTIVGVPDWLAPDRVLCDGQVPTRVNDGPTVVLPWHYEIAPPRFG